MAGLGITEGAGRSVARQISEWLAYGRLMRHTRLYVFVDRRRRVKTVATSVAAVAAPAALIEGYRRSREPWVLWAACACVVAELITVTHWSVIAFAPEDLGPPWDEDPALSDPAE